MNPACCVVVACFALLWQNVSAVAQRPTPTGQGRASLSGRVVDSRTGRPVPYARVYITGVPDTIRVATDGHFATDRPALGAHVVEVGAIGYTVARWVLELGEAGADLDFELEPMEPLLDTISIAGRRRDIIDTNDWRSPAAFERRRHRGGGDFLTFEQIRHSHTEVLGQLLRSVPGVMVTCSGRNCSVLMAAALHRCPVDYYLDGAPATNATGPSFPVSGIRAIEVYRAADVPVEFARPNSMCGIVAIWTNMER